MSAALFDEIGQLKQQLDAARPLPPHTLKSLHDHLIVEWTYNSNAIEGNTLTLKETKVVLEGITIGGKSMREHFETINHKEAIDYVGDIVRDEAPLSEMVIKDIHQLVLKNIDNDNAGRYRQENVLISGAEHIPPAHYLLNDQMAELLVHYQSFNGHVLERAARLHVDFVKIHPFIDGNGRTARLLMNLDLMKGGYQPVVIKAKDKLAYYEALDKAHTQGDYQDFIALSAEAEKQALQQTLSLIS